MSVLGFLIGGSIGSIFGLISVRSFGLPIAKNIGFYSFIAGDIINGTLLTAFNIMIFTTTGSLIGALYM